MISLHTAARPAVSGAGLRARPGIRSLPAVAALAAAIAVAGCGSGGSGGSGNSAGTSPNGKAMSASQILSLAARKAANISSFSATMNISSSGTLSSHMSGRLEEQVKPTVLAHETFNINSNGQSIPGGMETLLTGNAVYVKISSLQQQLGKPWIKISFTSLKHASGVSLAPLIHQLQGNNPLAQARMLPAAKNVHRVGTATVNGVQTTVYTGSVNIADALNRLGGGLRKLVGPFMSMTGITTARFTAWIDGQHLIRKLVEKESGANYRVTSVMVITSINQPVHVSVPPASQVTTMPGL